MHQRFVLALAAACLSSQAMAASNFTISPKAGTTLPTSITAGGSVTAYYTITNNTHSARNGYVIRGLPASVAQATGSGLCGNPVNLAGSASCTLQLNISAPVTSSFSLCRGASCTSASVALNVAASSRVSLIAAGGYNNGTGGVPLIATSQDQGVNWTYTLTGNMPLPGVPAAGASLVAGECDSTLCIAVGGYSTSMFITRSTDGGNTWNFPVSGTHPAANQPVDFNKGYFTTESCNGAVCVAAGIYQKNGSGSMGFPILASSQNSGVTWAYHVDAAKTIAQIPGFGSFFEELFLASCGTTACIGTGTYASNSHSYPMVVAGNGNGLDWHYTVYQGVQLPGDLVDGTYFSALCSGTTCFAGGGYHNGSGSYPLLGRSTDGGNTWSYPISATSIPPGLSDLDSSQPFNSLGFSGLSCSGSICVAAGGYKSTVLNASAPMIATSNDGGITWKYTLSSTTPMQGDSLRSGSFYSVSCSGATCIASGFYQSNTTYAPLNASLSKPLIATSKDGGQTWTYSLYNTTPFPDAIEFGVLTNAQCKTSNVCIAMGVYSSGSESFPLLVQSSDGGSTWVYAIYSASPALPQPFNLFGYFGFAGLS